MLFISLMALQPPPLVALCLSMLPCMCMHGCGDRKSLLGVTQSLPALFFETGFPLNPVLPSLTKLTGSQAPWIPLLLIQHGDYGHMPTASSCFMSGLGIELRNPCLYSKHFAAKPSPRCQSCCIFEPPKAPDFSFHLERLDYLVRNLKCQEMGFMFAGRLRRAILFSVILGLRINLPADVSVVHFTGMSALSKLGLNWVTWLCIAWLPQTLSVCMCAHADTHK